MKNFETNIKKANSLIANVLEGDHSGDDELSRKLRELHPQDDLEHCEAMGYDCAKNGANETNCNFRIFGTATGEDAWERGKEKFLGEVTMTIKETKERS